MVNIKIEGVSYQVEEGMAKMEIGIARGKKLYDKRQDIAKRDTNRQIDRLIKIKSKIA